MSESSSEENVILNAVSDGVTVNTQGIIVYVNETFAKMVGIPASELLNMHVNDVTAPEYHELINELTLSRQQGKDVVSIYEAELVRKDGTRFPVEFNVVRIDYHGKSSSLTTIRDITTRKETEQRFEDLLNLAPVAIMNYSITGSIISCNQATSDMTGYSNEELVGKHLSQLPFFNLETVKNFLRFLPSIVSGQDIGPVDFPYTSKAGENKFARAHSRLITTAEGRREILVVVEDTTEQSILLNTLRVSEERYRELFESLIDGFAYHEVIYDDNETPVDYKFLEINERFSELVGLGRDILGKNVTEVIPGIEDDPADWIGVYGELAKNGQSIRFEQYAEPLDKWYNVSAYSPKHGYFATVFQEITDQKSYEKRLEALHGHATDLTLANSLDDVARITRDYLEHGIGFSLGGLAYVEGDVLAHLYPWGLEVTANPFLPLNGPGVSVEAVNKGKTLNIKDVRDNPLFLEGFSNSGTVSELAVPIMVAGKAVGVIDLESKEYAAYSENDQKLVETLASHVASAFTTIKFNERLNALYNIAIELSYSGSLDEVVKTASHVMEETFELHLATVQLLEDDALITVESTDKSQIGYTMPLSGKGVTVKAANEARSILLGDVRTDPDFYQYTYETLSELAVPIVTEERVIGVLNIESLELSSFNENDKRLLEVLAQNVGAALSRLNVQQEKAELEKERDYATRLLFEERIRAEHEQKLSEMKTQFITTATHELRTPVTSIIGYLELIFDESSHKIPDKVQKDLNIVYRNANRLVALINDLLDVQRITSGRFNIQLKRVDIIETLNEMKEELTPLFTEKQQELYLLAPKELRIPVDEVRFSQLLANLLRNANKFTPIGGKITVNVEQNENNIQVSVEDSGIGLTEEDISKLFTPFPNIRHNLGVSSTGLGLAICKGIIELHGGEIWAESNGPGKGSTFIFTLPAK